jgi:hypothetical protein
VADVLVGALLELGVEEEAGEPQLANKTSESRVTARALAVIK